MVYLSVNIKQNDCFKLQSFISENSEFSYQIEKNYGYTVSLDLENVEHDLSLNEIKKKLGQYAPHSEIDYTNRILNFRLANDILKESVKVNFFCAYWAEFSTVDSFNGEINVMFEVGQDNDQSLERDFKTTQNEWINMSPDTMLYELRMYADDFSEILTSSVKFENHDTHFTKKVAHPHF